MAWNWWRAANAKDIFQEVPCIFDNFWTGKPKVLSFAFQPKFPEFSGKW